MERIRQIIFYEDYFKKFFDPLPENVKDKIDEVLYLISIVDRIPSKFFSAIEGIKGLFEIRIEFESNIYRIFCCFDEGRLVVLFNGFQKKTQKTPTKELEKVARILKEYQTQQKTKRNGNK